MLLVGLTGGIGTGKSTVARMLARRGAVVVDADELARRAVAPGTPGHAEVVARFGRDILAPDGSIDRKRLADVVFSDPAARRDLEAIIHPEVVRMFAEEAARHRGTDHVVVYVAPLLVETGRADEFDVLVVVTAPEEAQVERLVRERGMTEEEVRARIAAQLPQEEKAARADVVLDNGGPLEELERQVDELWRALRARAGSRG
jgi:dephospho-CoA kinase